MTDVIERLRAAEDRTEPPGPFDLAAAVRAGEARRRRRHGTWAALGAAVAAVVVAGTAFSFAGGGASRPDVAQIPDAPLQDVDALLGEWSGHEPEQPESEAISLTVTSQNALVTLGCITVRYQWAAHPDGLMLMDRENQTADRCGSGGMAPWMSAPWASKVGGFAVRSDQEIDLVDGDGTLVAVLTRTAPAPPRTRPVPTAAPLPEGVEPATKDLVDGRWYEAGSGESLKWVEWSGVHVTFPSACPTPIRWVGSPRGGVVFGGPEPDAQGRICAGLPVPVDWHVREAERAGFDGDALVLFDAAGDELAVLTRDGSATERTVTAPEPSPTLSQQTPSAVEQDPDDLVGDWVSTAVGRGVPFDISMDGLTVHVQSTCGEIGTRTGSSTSGLFAVRAWWPASCTEEMERFGGEAWSEVRGYLVTSDDAGRRVDLIDDSGSVVITWQERDNFLHDADPPADLAGRAAALAATFVEPGDNDLLGRWVPKNRTFDDGQPFVSFLADGSWSASDGCNGQAGNWSASTSGGLVLAPPDILTQVGCDGAFTLGWGRLSETASYSFEQGALVLRTEGGDVLARLVREAP